ncbi:MAG: tetratricopeptide repeat protein [Deltaproteobacteria bacterium]|nr:MAG: tetratricopeptide repeat protein [Deltaproteobacteria bacterium]
MRHAMAAVAAAAAACQPSATVTQQSPIANLQTYRVALVRATAGADAQGWTAPLEAVVADRVARVCRFDAVLPAAQAGEAQADLIVDLSIQRLARGGDGVLQNPNKAVMDVLLVLSDGAGDDLVGQAWIRGESPAVFVAGAVPEEIAAGAVADSVARLLAASGCGLARVDPPPAEEEPPGGGTGAEDADSDAVARAEQLNDEGKRLFRAGDLEGAATAFAGAVAIVADPRYYFNLCFAYEALERYDDALAQCRAALDHNPSDRLRAKTQTRIDIIERKRAGK